MLRTRVEETVTAPFVVGTQTITCVAHRRSFRAGGNSWGIWRARGAPAHIEVIDAGGVRSVVPIQDVGQRVNSAIAIAAVAVVLIARSLQRRTA